MNQPDPKDEHIQRLRQWRNKPEPDLSLEFVEDLFKKEIAKPHKQVGQLVELWEQYIPKPLADRTAMQSFQRGVLNICVGDSATLYQLDRLLRSGVEQQLRQSFKGNLRRIKLQQGVIDLPEDGE